MTDSKVADLTAITTLGGDELVYVVDDPAGTPLDRKITAANFIAPYLARGAYVTASAAQSIANNTVTSVNFDTETFDTDSFHDNVTNNTRLTIPTGRAGLYTITAIAGFAANATGYRMARLHVNGTYVAIAQVPATASLQTRVPVSAVVNLAAADYVELAVAQLSTVSLNTDSASTFLSLAYLGPTP